MRTPLICALAGLSACIDCPEGGCDLGTADPTGTTGGAPLERAVTLLHTDPLGTTRRAEAVLTWALAPDESAAELLELDLVQPVPVQVAAGGHMTVLKDYEIDTELDVHGVRLGAPVLVALDARGHGTVPAEVPLLLDLTVTPPEARPLDQQVLLELPWRLELTVTDGDLEVAPWPDGFGGTFELR